MMNIDHTILTVIIFVPLAGAVLLALLPDKGKLMQWGALAVTLITFVLTLHLPIRYDYSTASGTFQFDQNLSWIDVPGHPLPPRRRWPVHVARRPHGFPRTARRPHLLEHHQ